MHRRSLSLILAAVACAVALVPAQSRTFPVEELRPGMVGVGRTVFEGDRLDDFTVHIIGVLRNVIGPQRNLILARLEGGPLANTGVIAGMSGSPVYIDDRLVGAVSYSLGQFSKEPIAGITPIDEMFADATLPGPRPPAVRAELPMPPTPDALRASLKEAFAWTRPFAASPSDVQVLGAPGLGAGIATMLRPIATPITIAGFDGTVVEPLVSAFRDQGFVPVMAGAQQSVASRVAPPLRPGDPIGVSLMSGDLELGATGTVTAVEGSRVYAFGHPFYGLGPTQFPMTRAYVHTVLPSLISSMKIASTGDVIGSVTQDRATTIAGTLGPGPRMIPISLTLTSERGTRKTFRMQMVNDQLFTPLLSYLSILNTLTSYERQNGVASYSLKGSAAIKNHAGIAFEDLFSGEQGSAGAASSVVAPINFLLRNAFEEVEIEGLTLDVQASEDARTASIERVWTDGARVRPGATVGLRVLLRTFRGEEVTQALDVKIPPQARGTVSVMVSDAARLAQWEARELQTQPLQTRGLPQMIRVLNTARKNNRLYVRLLTREGGAVVKGESLTALPPSVLAVIEADRNGGNFRPLQSAVLGEWDVQTDHVVTGSRTLSLPIED
jgi:hypothetical protein